MQMSILRVNFISYWSVWPEFIIPARELVQKHLWIILLKISVLTELYWTYCQISDILAKKWKLGISKNLKKMKEVYGRKLMSPSSLVVFPGRQPFPPAFFLLFCTSASPSSSFSSSASSSSSSVLTKTTPLFLFLLF